MGPPAATGVTTGTQQQFFNSVQSTLINRPLCSTDQHMFMINSSTDLYVQQTTDRQKCMIKKSTADVLFFYIAHGETRSRSS
jgi:hypothetical protein